MMTKEEMQEILRDLELDYEAEPTLIYLFYVTPDGKVNNFSISLRRGGHLSDRQLERLMRREYPATRQGTVIHTERPGWISRTEWMDVTEVCNMLHISERPCGNGQAKGLFTSVDDRWWAKLVFQRDGNRCNGIPTAVQVQGTQETGGARGISGLLFGEVTLFCQPYIVIVVATDKKQNFH